MKTLAASLALAAAMTATPALATDYHYCVTSNQRIANVIVKSGPADFGKEWYRIRAAQDFCSAYGGTGCDATDFDGSRCGQFPQESIEYTAEGNQLKALVSGNPLTTGQAVIEIATGVTVGAVQGAGNAVHKICKFIGLCG